MRCLIGSMLLLGCFAGCANQLALSELSARNTVPPPGTLNRAAPTGNGYYNPLSFFQPNGNSAAPTPSNFAGNVSPTPIPGNPATTSPFWNLPGAAATTPPTSPVTDRWASRPAPPANSFGGATAPGSSAPAPYAPPPFNPNGGALGNNSFNTNGFNSGFQNRGTNNFGYANSASNYNGGTNPISSFFNQLFGPGQSAANPSYPSPAFGNSPSAMARGFANPAPPSEVQIPANSGVATSQWNVRQSSAPRFDFGAPGAASNNGEPPVRVPESALRELPRSSRATASSREATRSGTNPAPLARPSSMPLNNLPTNSASPPAPAETGDYIEITRLPAGRNSAT